MAAKVLPARSLAPVVIVAVYVVPDKRLAEGVKYAVLAAYVIIPVSEVAPCFKVKVVAVRVNGFIGTLKVAVIILLRTTPVTRSNGSVENTVGDRVAPVLKVHT